VADYAPARERFAVETFGPFGRIMNVASEHAKRRRFGRRGLQIDLPMQTDHPCNIESPDAEGTCRKGKAALRQN
jgi:hypothetical protein